MTIKNAATALEASRTELARWEATAAASRAELESMQDRAAEEVLDDPALVDRLPREMAELRGRLELADGAAKAQAQRVAAAEAVYLEAQATALEGSVRGAREALDKHQSKTDRLLAQLAEHEGVFVLQVEDDSLIPVGTQRVTMRPVSEVLAEDLAVAELRVRILRAMAAREDVGAMLRPLRSIVDGTVLNRTDSELYPACVWGPGALVPAPEYRAEPAAAPVEV